MKKSKTASQRYWQSCTVAAIKGFAEDAVKYPLPLRIAAWFIRETEEKDKEEAWHKMVFETKLDRCGIRNYRREFACLPHPVLLGIQNYIRDIQRGVYRLESIPKP